MTRRGKQTGGLRFVGGPGQFHPGVPARDLTAEEAERYAGRIEGSRLYEPVERSESEPPDGAEDREA